MRKSNRVRIHDEKERWGESSSKKRAMGGDFTVRKSNGVRVDHEKKSDGVRVHREKDRWGESSL